MRAAKFPHPEQAGEKPGAPLRHFVQSTLSLALVCSSLHAVSLSKEAAIASLLLDVSSLAAAPPLGRPRPLWAPARPARSGGGEG